MSVNLAKNRTQIQEAYKNVLEGKNGTDWALYGYEGTSNDLKVVSQGNGGMQELAEDLNTGAIQYAFLRVTDPTTTLTKFAIINWQGEGAQMNRKAMCAKHIRDIANMLKGHHITIAATNEDDVDEDIILKKLANITSEYNFKERVVVNDQKIAVGTNYRPVIPTKEIDPIKRDEFWRKEELEEKGRVVQEFEIKKMANLKIEEERRSREEREHLKREQQVIAKSTPAVINKPIPVSMPSKVEEKDVYQMPKADQLRMERRKEVGEMIGSKVNATKALFMQNAASNQTTITSNQAPAKPIRKTIVKQEAPEQIIVRPDPVFIPEVTFVPEVQAQVEPEVEPEPEIVQPEIVQPEIVQEHKSVMDTIESIKEKVLEQQMQLDLEQDQFSTIKRSPYSKTNTPMSPPETSIENIVTFTDKDNNANNGKHVEQTQQISPTDESELSLTDSGLKARALYDYQAADDTEITFDPGDLITHIDQIDEGWWQGLGPSGTYGLFPANYVELI